MKEESKENSSCGYSHGGDEYDDYGDEYPEDEQQENEYGDEEYDDQQDFTGEVKVPCP